MKKNNREAARMAGYISEFLHDYAYILREFGYRDQARATAEKYLALVPDDVNMQTFLEDY